MQYRKFGKLDWQASALGFGCMRLPTLAGDSTKIDEAEATRIVRHAIDQGVNYIDTAYGYHGGNSERFLGRALQDGYRDKVRLATKLPCWLIKTADDFEARFSEQLQKLQTDHVDFYLLHGLSAERWRAMRDLGVIPWAEQAMAGGRIRHGLCFSFHDSTAALKEIVDGYDNWTMCQIQHNYMDIEEQAGTAGLRYAASKGLAVVVMEPLLGGKLANPPAVVRQVFEATGTNRTPADWALQWLWDQPEVSVVLSGMSAMQQVLENLESAGRARVGSFTQAEQDTVAQARETYKALSPIACTSCEYCQPCPNNVKIPRLFEMFNSGVMYESFDGARWRYSHMPEQERASACIQCLECEKLCPQHIDISDWMKRIHEVLGEGKPYQAVNRN
jgi:uncharacterized protein